MTSSSLYPEGEALPLPSFQSYDAIKRARDEETKTYAEDSWKLNEAHDRWVLETTALAVKQVENERGRAPAHFAFFLMGSAGRKEQGVFSDQDHGIVFEGGEEEDGRDYFLALGAEIREGMAAVGYPRCEGKVMASHPRWCHSREGWKQQIEEWVETDTWSTFRHLLTFIDARPLFGRAGLLTDVKNHVFRLVEEQPKLLRRLSQNISYLHQGVNAFGQLLPDEKGPYAGSIHLKDVGFFPYVHAMRLLAIKEGILKTPTLERMRRTAEIYPFAADKERHFNNLLKLRSAFAAQQHTYEDVHYIPVDALNREQKQELKAAVKEGKSLFQHTKKLAESGENKWL
ncbi:DUF294 nucleotidyltransferase-like domain-containing protein [Salibacterium halotolerans]|uniref:CBS domain-containing protein n=1 Tax=Salibacterium halotolerans TaxID=1884432 RepID=A0A1I5U1Z7_9BACI|nr:DUF294 nucleotidyltransferase-like domain-containing protein [Salibacterium halotolerans]SFP89320.1 CBS domain-containing protein [Salibacterium halotolerans]